MRHMNGRINSIMDRPLPRTPLDMKYELGEWKRKLSENYDLVFVIQCGALDLNF